MLKLTDIVCPVDPIEIQRFDNVPVVYFSGNRQLEVMNEMGVYVLELLDGRLTLSDMLHRVVTETDVNCGTADREILKFLSNLQQKGLIAKMPSSMFLDDGEMYIANPDVLMELQDEGEAVLFNRDIRKRRGLNNTATVMWQGLQRPRTVKELIAYFCSRVDADPDETEVQTDIRDFINDMYESGFIGRVLKREQ